MAVFLGIRHSYRYINYLNRPPIVRLTFGLAAADKVPPNRAFSN